MIKVIGIGNRLMKDDGIAIAVLERIKNNLETVGMEVIIGETDFLFCFHQLKDEDFVIILDATYFKGETGTIHTYKLQDAIMNYGITNAQHDMSILDLIMLYSKSFSGYLIGIEIAETGLGCELSEALKGKLNSICLEIEKIICKIVKEDSYARYVSE